MGQKFEYPGFSCNICGAPNSFELVPGVEDQVRCLYCRNLHWRPDKEPDDQSRRLLQRADSCCEELRFDDAQGLYRRVLENDKTNADALWGVIRCAYHVQILYEDGTKKTVAVCLKRVARDIEKLPEYHKLRETPEYPKKYASFVENVRQQQETLNKLWRSLADSDENLYDVYICYKETERFADGHTAPSADRGLVRNLYRQLTSQIERDGKRIRIFYAPESLRNLSGAPYSAGITHALSTSRVMLLIASKPEYLQTTWVRSERERFRELMQEDGVDRALLPLVDPSQPQSAYAGDPGIQYITIQHSRDAVNPGSVQEILRRIESVLARDDRSDPYRRTTERRLREIQIQQEQEKRERELQRVREEAERRAREEARQEADRRARAEEERRAQEERERQIREETERRIQQEADRRVRAETDRIAREEAARKAREDSDRRAREEASRRAREEADRQARAEAERRAKEEDERRIQEEIDRRVRAVFEQRDREEARRKADEEARQLAEEEAREEEARRRAEEEAAAAASGWYEEEYYTRTGGGNSAWGIDFIWPAGSYYDITSYFGYRSAESTGYVGSTYHQGIDIGNVFYSTPVVAAASGVVTIAEYSSSAGNYVCVSHGNGVSTVYMHMSYLTVSPGETVYQGEQLGVTGSTGNSSGPHLHFGVMIDGYYVDPLDYLP